MNSKSQCAPGRDDSKSPNHEATHGGPHNVSFPPHLNTKHLQHNLQANRGPSRTNKELAHDEELHKALRTGTGRGAKWGTKRGR